MVEFREGVRDKLSKVTEYLSPEVEGEEEPQQDEVDWLTREYQSIQTRQFIGMMDRGEYGAVRDEFSDPENYLEFAESYSVAKLVVGMRNVEKAQRIYDLAKDSVENVDDLLERANETESTAARKISLSSVPTWLSNAKEYYDVSLELAKTGRQKLEHAKRVGETHDGEKIRTVAGEHLNKAANFILDAEDEFPEMYRKRVAVYKKLSGKEDT